MISPRALRIILRHFDAIDETLSKRLTRKRPWSEEALTGLLCDLLDNETQVEESVSYTLEQVHDDLAKSDEPLSIRLKIDTHQYPKHVEHWVTQSDLGLIVKYQNQFDTSLSRSSAWLLQAKRVFPSGPDNQYSCDSKFKSSDADQHQRMKALRDWAQADFIRYLLYCPRPKNLDAPVREALNQLRTNALGADIFDYTLGLELRDDLLSANPTVAAGVFVGSIDSAPDTLGKTHSGLFRTTTPFSWFIVQHMASGRNSFDRRFRDLDRPESKSKEKDIERLVRGDHRVLEHFDLPDSLSANIPPRVLPAHTIEISVTCGIDRPRARG